MLMSTKRNSRLLREVGVILATGTADSLAEALMRVINTPLTKGFYIAPDTAMQVDQRRRKMGTTKFIQTLKHEQARRKWTDFFAAVDARKAQFPTITHEQAVLSTLAEATAPHGFYINYHEAIKIIRR